MYKKASRLILGVLLLTLLSCSTFSPFMKGKNYSTLPLVFDRDETTVIVVSFKDAAMQNLVLSLFPQFGEFVKRSSFLTVAFMDDGTVMGAFEGYYPIDSIRLLTGKNTVSYGDFNVYSPDGGIVAFTSSDVRESKEMMFENREEKGNIDDIKHYYEYPFSVYGKATPVFKEYFSVLLNLDKTYMDFNKIDISFNFDEEQPKIANKSAININGNIDFNDENTCLKFTKGVKASLVGMYRQERLSIDIKTLDNKLTVTNLHLGFQKFPYYFSYSL